QTKRGMEPVVDHHEIAEKRRIELLLRVLDQHAEVVGVRPEFLRVPSTRERSPFELLDAGVEPRRGNDADAAVRLDTRNTERIERHDRGAGGEDAVPNLTNFERIGNCLSNNGEGRVKICGGAHARADIGGHASSVGLGAGHSQGWLDKSYPKKHKPERKCSVLGP